jgi:hypothetical protein
VSEKEATQCETILLRCENGVEDIRSELRLGGKNATKERKKNML